MKYELILLTKQNFIIHYAQYYQSYFDHFDLQLKMFLSKGFTHYKKGANHYILNSIYHLSIHYVYCLINLNLYLDVWNSKVSSHDAVIC